MFFLFIVIFSIWFNYNWLVSNESFILAIFLITFFFIIYIIVSFSIKIYFFFNISNILNLLKYSNIMNIYLDKILYSNIFLKNKIFIILLKKKENLIKMFNIYNNKFNIFLFFNILNFFLQLKKNLFKILKNKNLIILRNKIKECDIIL